jgi:serine/threonine protein kinase
MANLLALPHGTELVGDYRIKRVLGAGGFGITYLADELALARRVTIKEYFPTDFAARKGDIAASPRSRDCAADYKWGLDRFIAEAQTLAKFDHPNIIRVYRYFRANNTGYMVLQFEEGQSFKAWLTGLKRAPRQAELDDIIAPLLDALELIHKGDFLHRDIAPDNIIIRKKGAPVLIDFGSARGEIAAHSKTVSALVKPGYSPYEQYATSARQQGAWTDIYALGATLYFAVAGKRPPDAPTRVVNDEMVPARTAALSSYRPGFLAAIDNALALEVSQRPQSIAQWRKVLLTPEPKRDRPRFGVTVKIKKPASPEAKPAEAKPAEEKILPLGADPVSVVPPPPDTPSPKGQLLDFIDALKKGLPMQQSEPQCPGEVEVLTKPKYAPSNLRAGLGYGPGPAAANPAAAISPEKSTQALSERVERRAPRAYRVHDRRPTRRWAPLALKLAIGLTIAGLAVAYEDRLSWFEQRSPTASPSASADIVPLNRVVAHKGGARTVAVADEGRSIVSTGADATIKVWESATVALVRTIALDDGAPTAFAVDGKRALSGHKNGMIQLWDLERGERIALYHQNDAAITAMAFAGEANRFAIGSQDGTIALWDAAEATAPVQVLDGHGGPVISLALTASADIVAAVAYDGIIKFWKSDGARLMRSFRVHADAMTIIEIDKDWRALASAGGSGTVRLWSLASPRLVRALRAHAGRVTALAFAGNEPLLATAGEDGAVRLWDVKRPHSLRAVLAHGSGVRSVAFTGDGKRLISGADDGTIRIFNLPVASAHE